jgi:hypothetical protein
MVTANDIMPDRYRSGRYLRRWTLVEGFPRCVEDALDTTTASAGDIAEAEAANIAAHAAVAAVEAYEAALALTAGRTPPPALASVPMPDGGSYTPPNPALDAWQAAQAVLGSVTPETLALAALRKPVAPPLSQAFPFVNRV